MVRVFCVFMCFLVCLQLGLCQFGFFPRREERRQSPFTLIPGQIRETISGFLNPNRNKDRPITNDVSQGNQNYNQGNQYPTPNGIAQRPVAFPTDFPEEAPNNQGYTGQGNQGQISNQGNQGQFNGQGNQGQFNGQGNQEQFNGQNNQGQFNGQDNQGQFNGQDKQGQYNGQGDQGQLTGQGNQGQLIGQDNQGQFNGQGNQGQLNGQDNQGEYNGQGNQGQLSGQGNEGQFTSPDNQGNLNNQGNQPSQTGNVNFDRNETPNGIPSSQDDIPNDPVDFANTPKVEATPPVTQAPAFTEGIKPVSFPDTGSRNNFNYESTTIFSEPCTTVDGDVGSCINLYSCKPLMSILQQAGTSPAVARVLRQAHCGFEGNNPKVCCPAQGLPMAETTTTTTSTTTTTTTTPAPIPTPLTKEVKPSPDGGDFVPLPEPPVCGHSNASLGRVVGGENAKLGAFPWMALLGYKRGSDTRWLCGGSLVSTRHVLTAAHCIHNHENDLYLVRLGELDLASEDEGATPMDVLIKEKIKHEQYSAKAFTSDIGLLVLDRDVQYTELIKPICIPRNRELRSQTFERYNPIIAGWGDTEFRGPAATHLQVLQLPVVTNDQCATAYRQYKAQKIDERVLCAGYTKGGKDACQGDSGGPLMQPIYNQQTLAVPMYQIGVVSYGKKCAEAGFPGVYTRVTHFAPWLEEKITGRTDIS